MLLLKQKNVQLQAGSKIEKRGLNELPEKIPQYEVWLMIHQLAYRRKHEPTWK